MFSNAAVQFCLVVKVLFGLPLRQTTGMLGCIVKLADLDWPVPDFSTLCLRQGKITNRRRPASQNLLVDSTGIKCLGDGQWLARKHCTHRRRPYREDNRRENSPPDCFLIVLILAIYTGIDDIRAVEFASSREGDCPVLPELPKQIPPDEQIRTVTDDGAFDTRQRIASRDPDPQTAEIQIRIAPMSRFNAHGTDVIERRT